MNFTACDNSESFFSDGSGYDNQHITMTNKAIQQWDIGMSDGTIAFSRNLTGTYNPKNWSILSDEYCTGEGIPTDMQGANCGWQLDNNVIGVCQIRWNGAGEIVDSTFVMRQKYQDSAADELSKQVVYTHELGHCIGLRHSDNFASGGTDHVMWPIVNPLAGPHADELAAVDDAYNPTIQVPSGTDVNDAAGNKKYFYPDTPSITVVRRQYSTPVVHIYPYSPRYPAPKNLKALYSTPKTIPLAAPVTTGTYYIKSKGRCDSVYQLPNGTKVFKKSPGKGKFKTVKITKNK